MMSASDPTSIAPFLGYMLKILALQEKERLKLKMESQSPEQLKTFLESTILSPEPSTAVRRINNCRTDYQRKIKHTTLNL